MFIIIAKKRQKPRYKSINGQKIRSGKGHLPPVFFVLIYFSPTTACPPTTATNKTGHNKRGCRKLHFATCDSPFNTQKSRPHLKSRLLSDSATDAPRRKTKSVTADFCFRQKIFSCLLCQTCFACAFRCST